MTVPRIERALFDTPGDAAARPHSNCYWVVPGRILAGEHPGAIATPEVPARIDGLLDAGIRSFVDLTEEGERIVPYVHTLFQRAAIRNLETAHRRFAIRDFGVPSIAVMRAVLDAVYESMQRTDAVYVHCAAGIGRTGTVVGCLLREQGFGSADAIALIARKWGAMEKRERHPGSPERPEQFDLIERWPAVAGVDATRA